jgi:Domain of unknown function (DUF4214)
MLARTKRTRSNGGKDKKVADRENFLQLQLQHLNALSESINNRLGELNTSQAALKKAVIGSERRLPIRTSNLLCYYGDQFVEACYVHLLLRFPKTEELLHYETLLLNGASRRSIVIGICKSREASQAGVHVGGLRRLIFAESVDNFFGKTLRIFGANPGREIRVGLEPLLQLDGEQFLHHCYRKILGRESDPIGLAGYRKKLQAGGAKVRVIGDLAYSAEARRRRIRIPGLWWRYRLSAILPE